MPARQTVLTGDVAYFQCHIVSQSEDKIWIDLFERPYELERELNALVKQVLGSEFEVRSVRTSQGTITLLIVIGTTYYVISRWKNFVESLELLKLQIKQLITNKWPSGTSTSVSYVRGPAMIHAEEMSSMSESVNNVNVIIFLYLILSHAALLGFVLWLLVKRFQ